MLKKLSELDHEENLLVLKALAAGEIDEKTVDDNTSFAIQNSDYFLALQIASSPGNEELKIICIGEALETKNNAWDLEIIGMPSGELLETVRVTIPRTNNNGL